MKLALLASFAWSGAYLACTEPQGLHPYDYAIAVAGGALIGFVVFVLSEARS